MTLAEAIEAREALIKKGLLIDSGKRRLNKRTGEMDIVWEAVPATEVSPGVWVKKEGWQ
jgi:hypothetical protein